MMHRRGAITAILCIALAVSGSVSLADDLSVAYGEPQYTISTEGIKTVYYTPNLCSKDLALSIPAADKLILALDLGDEATVMSFQVAVVDQLNSPQQDQIVVRVGDIKPEQGPNENPLCSIATVNSSSVMTTFQCTQPLNGTYITVTKNDGGALNICGFSARLSDDSPAEGPFLSAKSLEAVLQNNQTQLEDLPIQSAKVFAAAPGPDSEDDPNVIVYDPTPVPEETPEAAPASDAEEPQREASFVGEQATLLPTNLAPVPVPAPGPSPALSPSTLLVLPSGEPGQVIVTSIDEVNSIVPTLAPTPGPSPVLAPSPDLGNAQPVQSVVVLASEPIPAPTDSESLTGLPITAEIGTPEPSPQILVVPVANNISAPSPAPSPEPSTEEAAVAPPIGETSQPTETAPADPPLSRANSFIAETPPTPVQQEAPPQQSGSGSSQASNSQSSQGNGLSSGDKAGIAVGVIAGVALIAAATYFVIQRRR